MASSYFFGHKIIWMGDETGYYAYEDGEPVDRDNPRPCPHCNKKMTPEGHDPCLGTLSGVEHACCGHGVQDGYITFESGAIVRFSKDVRVIDRHTKKKLNRKSPKAKGV